MLRKFRQVLWLTAAVLLIVFAAALALVRLASPLVSNYTAQLEMLVAENLGTPVRIGEMTVQWRGWAPRMKLRNVVLTGPTGEGELLRLKEVFFTVQLSRLLSGERMQIADIRFDGLHVVVRRDPNGRIAVSGIYTDTQVGTIAQTPTQDDGLADVLSALLLLGRIDFTNGSIVFNDAVRGIDYTFPKTNIHLQNTGDQHQVYAHIALPPALGEQLDIHLDLIGGGTDFNRWHGAAYIAGRGLQLTEWLDVIPDNPVALHSGSLDFSLWGDWREGQLQSVLGQWDSGQIALAAGDSQMDNSQTGNEQADHNDSRVAPWRIDQLTASAHWQRKAWGWDLAVSDIAVQREQQIWPRNAMRVVARDNEKGEQVIEGNGHFVPVADSVSLVLATVLSDTPPAQQLKAMQPQGMLNNWQFEYNTALPVKTGIKIASDFTGVGYRADGDIPGVEGLHGVFRGVGETLELDVDSRNVVVDARPLFRHVMQLDTLAGLTQVRLLEKGVRVIAEHLVVENADLKSSARFDIDYREGAPLLMDIQANFHDGQGHNGYKYLPVGIMDDELVEWIDTAVVGGMVTQGSLLLRGSAEDFPYANGEGVFEVESDVQDVTLNYDPDWPIASGVDAKLHFSGPSFSAQIRKGQVQESSIDNVLGYIEDMENPVVEVKGTLSTQVPKLIDFAVTGALSDHLYATFNTFSGSGRAGVAVDINLPIGEGTPPVSVKGGVTFDDAHFYLTGIDTKLSAVNGTVKFTQKGVSAENLQVVALDTPLSVDAASQPQANGQHNTLISIRGDIPVSRVLERLDIPFGHYFKGRSAWLVELNIAPPRSRTEAGEIDLTVHSDLVGTHIDLPAPLWKPVKQTRPFSLSVRVAGPRRLERWQARYADILSVAAKTPAARPTPQSVMLNFGGGEAKLPKTDGYYAKGNVDIVDFDAWRDMLFKLAEDKTMPERVFGALINTQLHINRLHVFNSHINAIDLTIESESNAWQINANSDLLSGYARLPRPFDSANAFKVHFYKFDYDALKANYINPLEEVPLLDPRTIPPFSITMDELLWQSYLLKQVNIVAQPRKNGLLLSPISVDNEYMHMSGTGLWSYQPKADEHNTFLGLRFGSKNIGKALEEMGKESVIGEGHGYIKVDLNWPNTLYSPDTESLIGSLDLRFKKGRVLTVDPGAGRLVGLLALQELPRRLLFDFSDATEEGTEFDNVAGGMTITAGQVRTALVRMQGPIGVIDMRGSSNLLDKTYDYDIAVLPQLGSTLPVLGAIATGGLAAGVTVFLTDNLLKGLGINIDALIKRDYTLTGSWDAPVFERVD